MKDLLRSLPVLKAVPPPFDVSAAPSDPVSLFRTWLETAIAAGVREPHAMTVSTIGADGIPDARVLILKDVTDDGAWWFAGRVDAAKGKQLVARPVAALTFYWPTQGRQIRLRGPVQTASAERSAQDFRERGRGAQASALTGRQGVPFVDQSEVARATTVEQQRLESGEVSGLPEWTLWGVYADQVEFWQSSKTREHSRVEYRRTEGSWQHALLWP